MRTSLFAGAVAFFSALAPVSFSQTLDWGKIFQDAVVRDPTTNDRARDRMFNEIMPKLLNGDASFTAAEVAGIARQLNTKEDGVRQQASGVLSVLAQFRPDSAAVLAQALSVLMDHVGDSAPRVQTNSLNALCSLRPGIPSEEVQFLISLMGDRDERLGDQAVFGVARMADSRADAMEAIEKALSKDSLPDRRIAAIRAITAAHLTSPTVLARLGELLGDSTVARETLEAISNLGDVAIKENLDQLDRFVQTSDSNDLVAAAKQLIERQASAR